MLRMSRSRYNFKRFSYHGAEYMKTMHPFHCYELNIESCVYYLDSGLFPEKRNGATDLYER